ncbi:MAG: hypothetical protein HQK96_18340 [Nitrospirae bacterium]|nr:hypothetical protein [Nitrospirota bacterium]
MLSSQLRYTILKFAQFNIGRTVRCLLPMIIWVVLTNCGTANAATHTTATNAVKYKISAEMNNPYYPYEILAGAGFPGHRDGKGLYALFENPMDIYIDDPFLYVLDNGGKSIRAINLNTSMVKTILDTITFRDNTGVIYDGTFKKILHVGNRFYLANSQYLLCYSDNIARIVISPVDDIYQKLSYIYDISAYDNGLIVLGKNNVIKYDIAQKKWSVLMQAIDGATYDKLFINKELMFLFSQTTGDCILYNLESQQILNKFKFDRTPQVITADDYNGRYIIASEGSFYYIPYTTLASGATTALIMCNIHGNRIGALDAPQEYRNNFLSSVSAMLTPNNGLTYYVLDADNLRVYKLQNYFLSGKYNTKESVNHAHIMAPEMTHQKPYGTNRILWVSHSVYYDQAGVYFKDNLYMGAYRQLQNLLNNQDYPNISWQVLADLEVSGYNFASDMHHATVTNLSNYGVDYVLIILDLNAFHWFMLHDGYNNPIKFNSIGMPEGTDSEKAGIPILERKNENIKMKLLTEYVKASILNDNDTPFFKDSGELLDYQFFRLWFTNREIRNVLIEYYADIINNLNDLCLKNGIKLITIVAPTTNFISVNEFTDAHKNGGGNKRYSFEEAHEPILKSLHSRGIIAYDISYEMIKRHTKYFPYNANTHHRSYLFHIAVAESINEILLREKIISLDKALPIKYPIRGD